MSSYSKIHELVERDRFELMMLYPLYYGRVICSTELVVVCDPRVRLACTDYRRIFISGDAYSALPEKKRLAILAHEALHIALRHAFRIGSRDKNRFEKAADAEVHFVLSEHFPDPYEIKCPREWTELTAEQIYELLPPRENKTKAKSDHCSPQKDRNRSDGNQTKEDKSLISFDVPAGKMCLPLPITSTRPFDGDKLSGDSGESRSGQCDKGGSMDDHDVAGQSEKSNPADDNTKNSSDGENECFIGGNRTTRRHSDIEGADRGTDGDKPPHKGGKQSGCNQPHSNSRSGNGSRRNVRDSEKSGEGENGQEDGVHEFRPRFDAETEMNCIALSSGMMMDMQQKRNGAAFASSPFGRLLKKLDKPSVSWQMLLRQFLRLCLGGAYSWTHPNRRFISKGLYLPGRRCTKRFNGIVALDTSPSTKKNLPQFVSELTGLLRSFGKFDLTILECAARILQVWNVSNNDPMPDIENHKFMCDWGTDFTPVFEYIRDHRLRPNVLIYFTDGKGLCPTAKPLYPVLWVLTKDGKSPAPWGQVIYYEATRI